jgi:hypothetical protein
MLMMVGERSASQSTTKPSSIMRFKSVASDGPDGVGSAAPGAWQLVHQTLMILTASPLAVDVGSSETSEVTRVRGASHAEG